MSYFSEQDIDTRSCGQADEDAWLDRRDGMSGARSTRSAMARTIRYDRDARDFMAHVEDVLIGFYGSYHAAEVACDEYVFETLRRTA